MRWLVLSYSLPNKPSSSARVALWRRLQRLGALPVTGTYVLPERPDCLESFTWLAQEIEAADGEAVVMKVEFEGLGEKDLVARFDEARAEAYAEMLTELGALEDVLKLAENELEPIKALAKLRRRFTEARRVDFFDSPAGRQVAARLAGLEQRLLPGPPEEADIVTRNKADYRGKTWVTRPQPHVDRLASAWLIRRFIDPEAVILYRDSVGEDEVSFDMSEADFGHTGSLCTFETLVRAFALEDDALVPIAHIVHELDLRDERYARPEAAGLDALLDGWLSLGLSDEALEQRGFVVFEGLYAAFSST